MAYCSMPWIEVHGVASLSPYLCHSNLRAGSILMQARLMLLLPVHNW